jgi:hypothetical protein
MKTEKEILNNPSHEALIGTPWAHEKYDDQEHHVYFSERMSLFLLANYETGIILEKCFFEDFNELVEELKKGWYLL